MTDKHKTTPAEAPPSSLRCCLEPAGKFRWPSERKRERKLAVRRVHDMLVFLIRAKPKCLTRFVSYTL